MVWTDSQQKRLYIEKLWIDQYFPNFQVKNLTSDTYWLGGMTTNGGNKYQLHVQIPVNFPDQSPSLYIVSPFPLYTYLGTKLADLGTSHIMHTFEPSNGCVQMCLFRSENWSADYTIFKCLKKARIWLEAFDEHLRTGTDMCDLVGTQNI